MPHPEPMRKLRRCPTQDQCSKNGNFCHFGLFWQNSGYWTKIHKFDIAAKCSTFYKCTFFPTCFEKKLLPPFQNTVDFFKIGPFPKREKYPQNQKKMYIILKYIFLGLLGRLKFAIWLAEIQNWAFRLDGRVWLSATIVRKSPLYFGKEGVYIYIYIYMAKLENLPKEKSKTNTKIIWPVLFKKCYWFWNYRTK